MAGTGVKNVFNENVTGLTPNTKYYVRAYAISGGIPTYGEQREFTTITILPVLTTTAPTNITATKARLGGNIANASDVGTPAYTERGVVFAITENPDIKKDIRKIEGKGTSGSFTVDVTGLTPNTTYFVRSYAMQSGLSGDIYTYGAQQSFKTPNTTFKIKIIDNNAYVETSNRIDYCYHDLVIEVGKINAAGGAEILSRNPTNGVYLEYAYNSKTKASSATAYYTINYDPGNQLIPRDNKLYIKFWVRNRTGRFSDNGVWQYDFYSGTGEYSKTIYFEYVSGSWRARDNDNVVSATYFSTVTVYSGWFNHFHITNTFKYSVEIVE